MDALLDVAGEHAGFLSALALMWLAGYAVACWFWPFTACGRCNGAAKLRWSAGLAAVPTVQGQGPEGAARSPAVARRRARQAPPINHRTRGGRTTLSAP